MSSARALPILMYHHVSPKPGLVTLSPQNFEAQLAWLAKHHYYAANSEDLAAFLAGQPLPKKSVMLTFDDAYLDNYVVAYPLLKKYGLLPGPRDRR
jgi:peptidoglycan/xylan/chitin deacetylase (PgdA/CDA1 family)